MSANQAYETVLTWCRANDACMRNEYGTGRKVVLPSGWLGTDSPRIADGETWEHCRDQLIAKGLLVLAFQ